MKFGLSKKNKIPLIIIGFILDLIIIIPEFLYDKFKRNENPQRETKRRHINYDIIVSK